MSHFFPADILLPKDGYEKWAVVACDQYTSEPAYWRAVEERVGQAPSALHIILPELYLSADNSQRIEQINATMQRYLDDGVFDEHRDAMIYVERTCDAGTRRGIVGMIDLDDYDYSRAAASPIRATEATVVERIPPRVCIRRDAPLEMPHILLLIDDPERRVIEPLSNEKSDMQPAYNFELMQGGGHIEGYLLSPEKIAQISRALDTLTDGGDDSLLFAVGDGNHSLATAKECYRESGDPRARFALVEVVNIHDASIVFEPIYRVLFGVDDRDFLDGFRAYAAAHGTDERHSFTAVTHGGCDTFEVSACAKLPVGTLQPYIDAYLTEHPGVTVDYIHGEDVVRSLCEQEHTLGLLFDGMKKDELFPAIQRDGSLPRKTFSMGHAADKRYYIEARRLK